ncbi:hypothetical protein [Oscillatoria salina]|uniref:hypothetical protein n=1 Tax=Oscillatoria salina TaxID=331517 RepID=UPI0013BBA72C|nr:hypothetical protein [Oscillatoria salina]MBZ8179945.1 hypothetical protein [Oscillatoria salina IIICB1]NET86830.1 hypothetical protein [Kamptonema sp. SIO1D9]
MTEIFFYLFGELIFWGLCYLTGRILIRLISFGKVRVAHKPPRRSLVNSQLNNLSNNSQLLVRNRDYILLSFTATCWLGLIVWLLVFLTIIFSILLS